ncbi:hypothetical protein CAPTEDRAFT_121728 [Capitella teleta]|uniref:G-protein coupled receptors family 1 profile domain-containing protein n=1 Tax=Capitella teleta TaxID=283909 RepID=R7U663_CAPTE|nr:hypothetical protein CAPTEDRAFT_121728 [Capitella teleta]|eukprot:ELT99181.1 hypothetical protein CAPTEDRAFT_121728 [Capitella teleta]
MQTPQLQTPTNLLICNQSVCDILFSILGQPFLWFSYTQPGIYYVLTDKWLCLLGLFTTRLTSMASLVAIVLLSLERSVAIFCPFRYYVLVSDHVVRRVIAASWLVSVVLNGMPLLGWQTWQPGLRCFSMYVVPNAYNMFIYTNFSVICLISAAIMNICIAVVATRKKNCAVNDFNAAANTGNQGNFKITKMLLKVVGLFYLCWMPFLVLTIFYTITPIGQREHLPDWFIAIHDLSKVLVAVNSVLNPVIYAHSNQQYRQAFKRILHIN